MEEITRQFVVASRDFVHRIVGGIAAALEIGKASPEAVEAVAAKLESLAPSLESLVIPGDLAINPGPHAEIVRHANQLHKTFKSLSGALATELRAKKNDPEAIQEVVDRMRAKIEAARAPKAAPEGENHGR